MVAELVNHFDIGWIVVVKGKALNAIAEIFRIIAALGTEIVNHVVVAVLFIKEIL